METWKKYLDKIDKDKADLVVKTLTTAKKIAPTATEELPYGVPGLKLNGKGLIAVAAHKNHLGIYPFSPSVVKRLKSKLRGATFSEGTIRFLYDGLPSEQVIKEIVDARRKEITSRP